MLKSKVVQEDEFEQGDRKLLNFGHTVGHAIENTYQFPHGHAVTIGMVIAAYLSENLVGFKEGKRVASLIVQYQLPAFYKFDAEKALQVMQADKKRVKDVINYMLLEKIGKGVVKPLKPEEIKPVLATIVINEIFPFRGLGVMQVTIQPSEISGNIYAPASKSSMQRACAAALVRKGETIIHNPEYPMMIKQH